MQYVIYSKAENGFWNNLDGWGNYSTATKYNEKDVSFSSKITDGVWCPFGIFDANTNDELVSVLSQYPNMPIRIYCPDGYSRTANAVHVFIGIVDINGKWVDHDDGGDNTYVICISKL